MTQPGRNGDSLDRVVVMTGASSGIGRATAYELAGPGTGLVLAARESDSLEQAAMDCWSRGSPVLSVPTDIGKPEEVRQLADSAITEFGHFDVWANMAAVMAYGRTERIPADVYRRVVEVNLFGTVEGSLVAMQHFRQRGSGHLVNVGSLYGRMTSPLVSPYVMSKFGVSGFTEVLREETHEADIHVSLVLPGSVGTPIFRHAANFSGRPTRPVPPVTDVARAAVAIARLISRPQPVMVIGHTHHLLSWGRRLLPSLYGRLAAPVMEAAGLEPGSAEDGNGNLFRPQPDLNSRSASWDWQHDLAAGWRGLKAMLRALLSGRN